MSKLPKKILFFANTDWYLFNFRLALAKHLREQQVEVVMVSPFGPYGKKLEEEGFRWIAVQMDRRSLNPLTETKLIWRLICIYNVEKPDIAHHFTIKCVVYGGLAASYVGIRGVVSSVVGLGHIYTGNNLKVRVLRPIVNQLLRFVMNGVHRRLVLQNPDDCQIFLSAGLIDEDHLHLIKGSGVDTQRFQPDLKKSSIPQPNLNVVFAARLLWDKGLAELIEAIKLLNSQGIIATYLIAGETDRGNPASVPNEILTEWRNIPNVILLGHVAEMTEILVDAILMVLPSFREGLPRSLIEAAAAGLPIVTTDVPGCREVVDHGVTGFLVPVRDSVALAEALAKLLKDPILAYNMGLAGRAKVLAEFDERIVFEKTLTVYRELVENF
ncbi:MAG: hypothetical protein RIQ94_224 [Pseudomonadota bacterium]|jgi:glycosyltransferase involved in cell wall biosynthesis